MSDLRSVVVIRRETSGEALEIGDEPLLLALHALEAVEAERIVGRGYEESARCVMPKEARSAEVWGCGRAWRDPFKGFGDPREQLGEGRVHRRAC